jgi:hypothetical protein
MLGERAGLEGGVRTSSVIGVTTCRVVSADASQFRQPALAELAGTYRRESAT